MVYTPCFEEIYSNIRNQSGCFSEMSFLKAGLYCISRARLKLVLISKVLRLISRYKGSYLKDALCSPLESLTKMFSPIICFGSVLIGLISNWEGE